VSLEAPAFHPEVTDVVNDGKELVPGIDLHLEMVFVRGRRQGRGLPKLSKEKRSEENAHDGSHVKTRTFPGSSPVTLDLWPG
jgi:hypothetical protein